MPKAVSLFSGAGGLDLGFERCGFDVVASCELDRDAAATWRENRPDNAGVMLEGDVRSFMGRFAELKDSVDVVFGGPPCQGFSVAGKMDPEDERSQLVWAFLDVVEAVRPTVFVMENVKALAVSDRWRGVRERYAKRCQELGYQVFFDVWDTSRFGVPQQRERVIFVGVRDGDPRKGDFERAMAGHLAEPMTAREVLLSVGPYGSRENPQTCTSHVSLAKAPVMRRSAYAGMLVNGAGRPMNLDGLPLTLPASMGGNKTPIIDQAALDDPAVPNWFQTYHDGIERGEVDPLTTDVPKGRLRRMTIAEGAAIQTFPSDYRFRGAKSHVYKQIGNAVPPLFAEAVAGSVSSVYFSDRAS